MSMLVRLVQGDISLILSKEKIQRPGILRIYYCIFLCC